VIINAKRKELLSQAKIAAKAASASHPLKELSGILFAADDRAGVVRMTATNLETAIRTTMPAAVERAGNTVIDAKLFLEILGKLSGDDVYMELRNNDVMVIRSGTAVFQLSVMQSSNYPNMDIPYPGGTVSVTGLKSLISRALFSVKTGTQKTVYHCLKFVFSENGLRVIGSNGFCVVQLEGDPDCKGDISLLIPASSLKILASIAGDNVVFELGVSGNNGSIKNAVFSDGTTLLTARLMDGEFFDSDKMFADISPAISARLDADKLCRALELVAGINAEHDCIEITVDSGGLKIRCETEQGASETHIDAMIDQVISDKYYFASKSLLGCARSLKGDITLCFTKSKMLAVYGGDVRYLQSGRMPISKKPEEEPAAAPKKASKKTPKKDKAAA
jgi:DNA polymerase-3 subunit beta